MKFLKSSLLNKSFAAACAAILALGSCSKTATEQVEIVPEKQFELRDIRYFMSGTDKLETVDVQLQDTTVYNSGNESITIKFASNLSSLVKTSQFQVANAAALPKNIDFERFQVNVPANIYDDNSLSYTASKVPFTMRPAEFPYDTFSIDTLTVKVPARSSIVINRSIQAQNVTCSFTAVIKEKTTGQTSSIQGTWKGLLRYDQLNTKLTERPL